MDDILIRFWHNLIGRTTGPLHFRLILQPAMATLLAVRAGLADARKGRPAFLWAATTNPAHRRQLLRNGWEDVGMVLVLAAVLDLIYQLIVHRGVYLGEVIVVPAALAIVPYVLLRGPINRIATRFAGEREVDAERDHAA
jgi:hypothetical protein